MGSSYPEINKMLEKLHELSRCESDIYDVLPSCKTLAKICSVEETSEGRGITVLVAYAPSMLRLLKRLSSDLNLDLGKQETAVTDLLKDIEASLEVTLESCQENKATAYPSEQKHLSIMETALPFLSR